MHSDLRVLHLLLLLLLETAQQSLGDHGTNTVSSLEVKGLEAVSGAAVGHKTHGRPAETTKEKEVELRDLDCLNGVFILEATLVSPKRPQNSFYSLLDNF